MIGAVVAIVYLKMKNAPVPDDPDKPKHNWNADLLEIQAEFQRPLDNIAYVNATNETTIVDIWNQLPRMTLDHIHSIHPVDESVNLTYPEDSPWFNDDFFGYAAG